MLAKLVANQMCQVTERDSFNSFYDCGRPARSAAFRERTRLERLDSLACFSSTFGSVYKQTALIHKEARMIRSLFPRYLALLALTLTPAALQAQELSLPVGQMPPPF